MIDRNKKRSAGSELIKYRKYRIIFQAPDQRKPRETVATFLELTDGVVVVSGRPVYGNAHIPVKWILSMRLTKQDTEVFAPRVYRGEVPKALVA